MDIREERYRSRGRDNNGTKTQKPGSPASFMEPGAARPGGSNY